MNMYSRKDAKTQFISRRDAEMQRNLRDMKKKSFGGFREQSSDAEKLPCRELKNSFMSLLVVA